MTDNNYKIHVNDMPGRFDKQVFIYADTGRKNEVEVLHFTEQGDVIVKTRDAHGATDMPPTFIIPENILMDLVKAFADYAKQKRLPVSEDSTVAELGATKRHLEDMRRLVFEPNEITSKEIKVIDPMFARHKIRDPKDIARDIKENGDV